jgi:hypothetical protein
VAAGLKLISVMKISLIAIGRSEIEIDTSGKKYRQKYQGRGGERQTHRILDESNTFK